MNIIYLLYKLIKKIKIDGCSFIYIMKGKNNQITSQQKSKPNPTNL